MTIRACLDETSGHTERSCVKKPVGNPLSSACIIGTDEDENLIDTSQNDSINL